ncbi:hypothetical protein KAJ61_01850 [Candidatus Parcubacteria bacterium]|nr:hypothetical protein [Candidatus Parcubacteria bacterium]
MIELLEEENFKIDSTGWDLLNNQGITYLQCPDNLVWEYVSGVSKRFIGQQLFDKNAAMQETKKMNKRIPTKHDWVTHIAKFDLNNLNLLVGCRESGGWFSNIGKIAIFWSSTPYDLLHSWVCCFDPSEKILVDLYGGYNKAGYSVRCLKN